MVCKINRCIGAGVLEVKKEIIAANRVMALGLTVGSIEGVGR